jgi:uncharacterized LabA/DUF88 family protein
MERQNNVAYIDGANLHKGVESLGWELNYKRFRVWLSEKYHVQTAYLFLGLLPQYKDLYTRLQEAGFTLIFKEVVYDGAGKPKGNCDADLVLKSVQDFYEKRFDKAILVSSDGDYSGLVSFLLENEKFLSVLSPSNQQSCSVLLKRTGAKIAYLYDQRGLLSYT